MGECMIVRRAGEGGVPDGMTEPTLNDVKTWVKCAGLSYGSLGSPTLATVVADADLCTALMNSQNAVNYMIRSTTLQTAVLGSATAIAKLDASSPFVSVAMTSNSAPSGYAASSSAGTGWNSSQPYRATGSYEGYVTNAVSPPVWIRITIPSAVWPYKFICGGQNCLSNASDYKSSVFRIQASADGSTWVDITAAGLSGNGVNAPALAQVNQYRYYRIYLTAPERSSKWLTFGFKVYGKRKVVVA